MSRSYDELIAAQEQSARDALAEIAGIQHPRITEEIFEVESRTVIVEGYVCGRLVKVTVVGDWHPSRSSDNEEEMP